MDIMKQLDESDALELAGFVEANDVYRGPVDEPWTEHRYTSAVYRRPLRSSSTPIATCKHEHRSIVAAIRCCRRLLRQTARELHKNRL